MLSGLFEKNVTDTRFINISLQTDKEEKGKDHSRGFNNFGDKRLFEVEQTAVIEKGP